MSDRLKRRSISCTKQSTVGLVVLVTHYMHCNVTRS